MGRGFKFRMALLALAAFSFANAFAQSDPEQTAQGGGQRRQQPARLSKAEQAKKFHMPPVVGMDAKTRMASYEQRLRMEADSPFSQIKWRSVGPETQSGRVVQIHSVPNDPSTILVAFATGGLYRTNDDGITWDSLFDNQSAYAIGDFATSKDGKTIWVGTGENNSQRTSYCGTGVFKSTDAGKTWANMGLYDSHRIGQIAIDPKNENVVWVAALGHLYSQNPERGLYKTTDGGKTWQRSLYINEQTGAIEVAIDPRNSNVVYASTWDRDRRAWDFREGGPGSAVYKTTDGGKTWSKLAGGLPATGELGRIGLAIAPSHPDTVYAFFDNQSPAEDFADTDERVASGVLTPRRFLLLNEEQFVTVDKAALEDFFRAYLPSTMKVDEVLQQVKDKKTTLKDLAAEMEKRNPRVFDKGIREAEVYRSDDSGKSWRRTHFNRIGDMGSYYGGKLVVNPTDPDDISITGVGLLRSRDGGRTWSSCAEVAHSDFHAVWFDPRNPSKMMVGTDGGMYLSGDGGEDWRHINNLAVGQFTTIAVDNKVPYNIYGGLQDNGTMKGPSTYRMGSGRGGANLFRPTGWTTIGGGDGSAVAVDPRNDGDIVFTASQFGAHSGQNQKTGERWSARPGSRGDTDLRFNWVSPILISAHHPDIVYLGANKLFRSFNDGHSYVPISPDLTKNLPNGNVPFSTIKDVSESPLQFGVIYVGCDDGTVKMTFDGGVQWNDIPTPQPNKWVSRIVASAYDKGTVFCSQSGYREDDFSAYLWKSTDYGKTWKSIVGDLPSETINVVREDTDQKDILYVGTDMGVFITFDGGTHWEALPGGMPHTPVHDLVIQARDNELVAGTHARSVWVLPLAVIKDTTPELRGTDLKVWTVDNYRRDRNLGFRNRGQWDISDPAPPTITVKLFTKSAGKGAVRIKDKDGKVVKEKSFDAAKGYNYVEVDLQTRAGKLFSTDPTKRKINGVQDALKDPHEDERPQYLPVGDYTLEVQVGDKIQTQPWKVTAP